MLNISNLDDDQQSKEGFVKSMLLFLILLAFCIAPFFAFSQSKQVSLGHSACKKGMIKTEKADVPSQKLLMVIAD